MIAFISPSSGSGALFHHRIDNAKKIFENLGFKVKEFPTTRKFLDGNAGTPEERVADIHSAFEDPQVKAIICNIGGLSCNELLDLIDYNVIRKNPKIFCGYSDITLLHHAFHKKTDLITFYGPAVMTQFAEFPRPLEYTLNHFFKVVSNINPIGKIEPSKEWTDEVLDWSQKDDLKRPRKMNKNEGYVWIKQGKISGKIFGGCLPSILQLKGTKYDVEYDNKILLIETPEGQDFKKGEPLDYVASQIVDLKNIGIFDKIIGLIIGRGFGYSQQEREKLKEIIMKHTKKYDFPVLFNADIGHSDPMITIPLNVKVTLDSENNIFSIDEGAVI
jgi:muramoyltetrapeptide carboxypeptidase LdcA involved in peptidoglycan recycling